MPPGAGGEYDEIAEPEPANQEYNQQQAQEAQYQDYSQQDYYQQGYTQQDYYNYHQVTDSVKYCNDQVCFRPLKRVAPPPLLEKLHLPESLLPLVTLHLLGMMMTAALQVFFFAKSTAWFLSNVFPFPGDD